MRSYSSELMDSPVEGCSPLFLVLPLTYESVGNSLRFRYLGWPYARQIHHRPQDPWVQESCVA